MGRGGCVTVTGCPLIVEGGFQSTGPISTFSSGVCGTNCSMILWSTDIKDDILIEVG